MDDAGRYVVGLCVNAFPRKGDLHPLAKSRRRRIKKQRREREEGRKEGKRKKADIASSSPGYKFFLFLKGRGAQEKVGPGEIWGNVL